MKDQQRRGSGVSVRSTVNHRFGPTLKAGEWAGTPQGRIKSTISDPRSPGWQRGVRLCQARNGSNSTPGFGPTLKAGGWAGTPRRVSEKRFTTGRGQARHHGPQAVWFCFPNSITGPKRCGFASLPPSPGVGRHAFASPCSAAERQWRVR